MIALILAMLQASASTPLTDEVAQQIRDRLVADGWTVKLCTFQPGVTCHVVKGSRKATVAWHSEIPSPDDGVEYLAFAGGSIRVPQALDGDRAQEVIDELIPGEMDPEKLSAGFLEGRASAAGWKGSCHEAKDPGVVNCFFTRVRDGRLVRAADLRVGGRAPNWGWTTRGPIEGRGTWSFGWGTWDLEDEDRHSTSTRWVRAEVGTREVFDEVFDLFRE